MLNLVIAGYWGPRREAGAQCAKRLSGFLESLSKQDELFSRWHALQRGRKEGPELNYKSRPIVLKVVEKVGPVQDDAGKVIPEWGFNVLLWNGENRPREATLNTLCGHYSDGYAPNVCILYPPECMPGMTDSDKMAQILSAVANHYEPDWGGVISTDSRNARSLEPADIYVDWIFYGSKKMFAFENLPPEVQTHPVRGLGSIVIVKPSPVDARKPKDLAKIELVEKALGVEELRLAQRRESQLRAERAPKWNANASDDEFVPPPATP